MLCLVVGLHHWKGFFCHHSHFSWFSSFGMVALWRLHITLLFPVSRVGTIPRSHWTCWNALTRLCWNDGCHFTLYRDILTKQALYETALKCQPIPVALEKCLQSAPVQFFFVVCSETLNTSSLLLLKQWIYSVTSLLLMSRERVFTPARSCSSSWSKFSLSLRYILLCTSFLSW